jgi:hypothetical protein
MFSFPYFSKRAVGSSVTSRSSPVFASKYAGI